MFINLWSDVCLVWKYVPIVDSRNPEFVIRTSFNIWTAGAQKRAHCMSAAILKSVLGFPKSYASEENIYK